MRFGKPFLLLLSIATVISPILALAQPKPSAQPASERFTVLLQGTTSSVDKKRFEVIQNETAFSALWNQHNAGISPIPPLPDVDFSKDMVIAGFVGNRNTGGYVLSFDSLLRKGNSLEAKLTLMQPSTQCMVAQMLTAPFVIVKAHHSSLRVSFKLDTKNSPGC